VPCRQPPQLQMARARVERAPGREREPGRRRRRWPGGERVAQTKRLRKAHSQPILHPLRLQSRAPMCRSVAVSASAPIGVETAGTFQRDRSGRAKCGGPGSGVTSRCHIPVSTWPASTAIGGLAHVDYTGGQYVKAPRRVARAQICRYSRGSVDRGAPARSVEPAEPLRERRELATRHHGPAERGSGLERAVPGYEIASKPQGSACRAKATIRIGSTPK